MSHIFLTKSSISLEQKSAHLKQNPLTLWITGLSGSGKSTLAYSLEALFFSLGLVSVVLDGDNLRLGLNQNLDFSDTSRTEVVRRVAEVAKLFNDAGIIVIVSLISPFERDRALAAEVIQRHRFVEIYMDVPLELCEGRDKKGIYQKARRGEIENFTGITSPYEVPKSPDFRVNSFDCDPDLQAMKIYNSLENRIHWDV